MNVFLTFELKQWLRSPMTWIFLAITSLLVFGAVSSDSIQIGGGVGSVYKNSPFVVESYYMLMSILCLLMTTAYMSATASRDISTGMEQFVFSSPISRSGYFFGKFIGAVTVAIIPLVGVSIGALLGPLMPWADSVRYGPIVWSGHLYGLLTFAIPNTLLTGAIVYSLAIIFRSTVVSFVGSMILLVLYVLSQGYTRNIEQEWLANLLDPFGTQPFSIATKYLTTDERNVMPAALEGDLLINRLVWVGIAVALLFVVYTLFSTTKRSARSKSNSSVAESPQQQVVNEPFRSFVLSVKRSFNFRALLHLIAFELKSLVKNRPFIIIVIIGLINLIASLMTFRDGYGATQYPVTYNVVSTIIGSFSLFVVGVITFYTGVLVWRDRDARISEIVDSTPVPSGYILLAKLIAMYVGVLLVLASTIPVAVVVQLFNGFAQVDLETYIVRLLVVEGLGFAYLITLSFLLHSIINNRYIAYFAFVAAMIVNAFVWPVLDVQSNMILFGTTPSLIYSDMNAWGPFVAGQVWFNIYWTLASLILCCLAYAFTIRGKETASRIRTQSAWLRLRLNPVYPSFAILAFVVCGGWVFYNTSVLNTYDSSDELEEQARDYELTYKKYEDLEQPRWIDLRYTIELYPAERQLYAHVKGLVVNKSRTEIREIHFNIPSMMDSLDIRISGAKLVLDDKRLKYRIYRLAKPMSPGDTLSIVTRGSSIARGFENNVSNTSVTQNGTFFNNMGVLPDIGYSRGTELSDKNKRREYGLPPRLRMPKLDTSDMKSRERMYLDVDADLVNVTTVFGTSDDQIAIAPGSLRREWKSNGRRYFEYTLDHPSANFYSFLSARYEVAREKWNGIDIEVYHIAKHKYNVPNMLKSIRRSLEYYTNQFGPYFHKQCRIIEFPRYSSFAQAFPGTMPYSESIGFITDLRDVSEDDIDFVFFVVAHEMGHQYWAHQLVGADMRGSEMLSESFAEYSALMVMEREYGREKMRKFLAYEMDNYLSGRSGEFEAERPIMETEGQGYIHYNKGAVVLYYLKEMIGESNVNSALRSLLVNYGYRGAPYPTSWHAVQAFRRVTPDSLQYLVNDIFENITLFSNRVERSSVKSVGKAWQVTVNTQSQKFRADTLGKETALPLRDYIDIGVFAEPAGDAKLGKPLAMQRVKVTARNNSYTFTVDRRPHSVGIDPYNYLVDRIPEDNVQRVK
jgi:ABC-2 type transport system permease protein